MTNEDDEYKIDVLKRSLHVLESIVNNSGLEEVEKAMSQYRAFAYARKDFDKDVMKTTEKAYGEYARIKRLTDAHNEAEKYALSGHSAGGDF